MTFRGRRRCETVYFRDPRDVSWVELGSGSARTSRPPLREKGYTFLARVPCVDHYPGEQKLRGSMMSCWTWAASTG